MAYIDQLRQKNPKLQNLTDRQIADSLRRHPDFQGMDEAEFNAQVLGAQPEPQQQSEGGPGFIGGVKAGLNQLQAMGGGLQMLAGDALDKPDWMRSGRESYQRNMEEAGETSLDYGFTDLFTDPETSTWQWAKFTAGNLLPMMATSIASGGVGGLAAGAGAKALIGATVKESAKRLGQTIGAATGSTGMAAGEIMGQTEDLETTLAHAPIMGALDALVPIRALRAMGKSDLADKAAWEISDSVISDLKRQAQRGTLKTAAGGGVTHLLQEASTEGLQNLVEQHAGHWAENNQSLLQDLGAVDLKAMVDEAAAGGLMGGLMGGPVGLGERSQARTQAARIEQARQQAAAQGGDALDQAQAAQQAEQTTPDDTPQADPAVSAEVGNRIQLAMGELDDLQALARGSSYQGQTRLRNITRMIDRAEQAFEEGNTAQAERMLQRADRIARNLRSDLEREGSIERPARPEGEFVGREEPQGEPARIGQDGRRLPPGDPDTIFGEGPTADRTQYDPQARNVRRDERMAAQQQGEANMRERATQPRPQLTDSGTIYGEGPVAGNANTGMDQQTDPPTQSSDAERMAEWERLWQQEGVENPAEGDFPTIDIQPGEPETDASERAGVVSRQEAQDETQGGLSIGDEPQADAGQAVRVPTERISVDPEAYQFRSEVDEAGTDGRLTGTREWDDLRAGNVLLHEREDGSLFVADGHHRVRLAQELGQPVVNAQIVREADGVSVADARRLAAEINIANDSATPLDAAKVFRDSDGSVEEIIAQANLPPRSTLVRDGIAISRLGDDAFGAVVNGQIDEKSAATIGRTFSDPDEQLAAVGVFQRVSPTNDTQRTILANEIRNVGFDQPQGEQGGLFGDDPAESLIGDRVRVLDRLRSDLVRDRRLFATLNRNAPRAEAAGNQINTEANQQQSDRSARAVELLSRVATDPGLNRAVNDAARRVRDGEAMATVVDELKTRLTDGQRTETPNAPQGAQRPADGQPAVRRGQEPGGREQGPQGDAARREGETEPRRTDQVLTLKADGNPFATETSAMASGVARRAKEQGQTVEAVPVDGGFGVRVQDAAQPAETTQDDAQRFQEGAPDRQEDQRFAKGEMSVQEYLDAKGLQGVDTYEAIQESRARAEPTAHQSLIEDIRTALESMVADAEQSRRQSGRASKRKTSNAISQAKSAIGMLDRWKADRINPVDNNYLTQLPASIKRRFARRAENVATGRNELDTRAQAERQAIIEYANEKLSPQEVVNRASPNNQETDALLETQTEESLAERERETQRAEQAEADQRRQEAERARADVEADDFRLAGSDRQADVLAAGGQQDLMGAQPARAESVQSDAESPRSSMQDMPDAIIHAPLSVERDSPDYQAAKAGDPDAAYRYVESVVDTNAVQAISNAIGNRRPVVVPVSAQESSGRNKIPLAYSRILGEALGLQVDEGIVQVNRPQRTQQGGLERLFVQPEFDGPVESGRDYLIVDDTLTQGGTFAALKGYIESRGGRVIAASALTGKQYSAKLSPEPALLETVRERFGDIEADFIETQGYGYDQLTQSEARYISRLSTQANAFRDRVAAGRDEAGRSEAGRHGRQQPESPADQGRAQAVDPEAPSGDTRADDPAFSLGSEDRSTSPTAAELTAALEGLTELGDVTVVQSTSRLPAKVLDAMAVQGINGRDVRGVYVGDELYVVADNVSSVQEGIEVAVHEAVGHKGMRGVLGQDLDRVMLGLYRSLPNSEAGRRALAEVREAYPFLDPSKREHRIAIGEEMVAHLLEKGHRPKAWQRAVSKIREMLRRAFPMIAWTHTDVLTLGEQSREFLRKRQNERQGGDADPLFSLAGKQRVAFEEAFDDFSDADKAAAQKIGARTPPQRAMAWFKEHADRAGLKIRQGMVDRVAALKEIDEQLYGESALGENINRSSWVLARMSNAANGALHAMLHNGRIRLDPQEKVIQMQDGDAKGLGEVLGRLGSAAEIERFMGWVAGNRSARLAKEGKENLFDANDIQAMQKWNEGNLEDGTSRAERYKEVFEEFQQYRDDVLAVAEQSGIISKDQREMWAEEFYVPFYRISEEKGAPTGQMATSGLSRQQAYKRLKGGTQNLNDLLQNTMLNFHHLLDASLKNQAAVQAVENAKQLGMAEVVPESNRDTKKSTFVMEDGRKVFYEIDDLLVFQALTALAHPGMNSTAMRVMRAFKRVFTNLTTTTPQFMVANLIRDSLQAAATNDVSKNVFKNVAVGAKTYKDAKLRAQMMASGASFNFGHLYQNNPDELRAQLTRNMRDAKLVDGPYMVPNVLRAGWAWWNDANNAAENLNRAAIYSQNRDKGELRAAFEARDLIDFSSHGAWPAVRILIDIVPFLNARIQGLDKIYRSGVKPGASVVAEAFGKGKANVTDKQAAGRFWTVTGALAAATIALYLHNQDDEEYQKLEDWQKDSYWFFRAGDQAFFIPKPFEVGAIATMAERITEQFVDDKATGKLFAQRMGHMMTDTFSFSPVPQAMQPALDIYANYDAFTGRPIESMGMDRLSPELRKRASTSKAGEWISQGLNATVGAIGDPEHNPLALSPVQVDHLVGGYLGQVGTWVASSGDVAWQVATGKEAPARHFYEYQPLKRFYKNLGDEDRYTRYGTIFYQGLREAGRAYADVRELREMGRLADAAEAAQSNREMLALRIPLNRAQSRLRRINQRMDIIRRSDLDGELKRARIDRLNAVKNEIQRAMGERIQDVRAR